MKMSKIFKLVAALVFLMGMSQTAFAAGIYGNWLTQDADAVITIKKWGDSICGIISKPRVVGSKDKQNKNPKLRDRPIKGLQMFKLGKTANPKKWEGKLYNPEDGGTYDGNIVLVNDQKLELEGCFLFICKANSWTKIN